MDMLLAGAFGGAVSLVCLIGGWRAGGARRKAPRPPRGATLALVSAVAAEQAQAELDAIVAHSRAQRRVATRG
jgi:hypothetical protein